MTREGPGQEGWGRGVPVALAQAPGRTVSTSVLVSSSGKGRGAEGPGLAGPVASPCW